MGDRNENNTPSPATVHDDVPDELLELVFLRLPSSLHLVRAACTCKRWRRIVADGSFLRRFRALHPRPVVAGHYQVDARKYGTLPPGCNPVFTLSPPADTTVDLTEQHFSLDFLPSYDGGFWDLADSRGGILLLQDVNRTEQKVPHRLRHLVVCDPIMRRCRVIAPPAFQGLRVIGAFLLDSDVDEAGGYISLENFRIILALYGNDIARACVFSSSNGTGGGWIVATNKALNLARPHLSTYYFAGQVAKSVYWTTAGREILVLDKDAAEVKFSTSFFLDTMYPHYVLQSKSGIVRCHDGTVRIACLGVSHLMVFIQAEGSDEWVQEKSVQLRQLTSEVQVDGGECTLTKIVSVAEGCITLGTAEGVGLISVDLDTMEFKGVSHEKNKCHGPAHMYQLPWPPTIRACLP